MISFDQEQKRKRIVALTGAGISQESGLKTFRDSENGLWEGYRIEDVATPQGWRANPGLVLDFYNERRRQAAIAQPNHAHRILAQLEKYFKVTIVTQNVDALHETAGSSVVLHLHGELTKARSTKDPNYVIEIQGTELTLGETCPHGGQLRPHIVWFGEAVPLIQHAADVVESCDILLIVGTSLVVYPAASLVEFIRPNVPIYLIDPAPPSVSSENPLHFFVGKACEQIDNVLEELLKIHHEPFTNNP